ncbi:MAG: hypothetical protein RBS80_03600 [Thermoguttaceae bacterium]|jgi:hypothetical protein|nr:hypothetical protein [Thermoguttaceae bacterium]
MATAIYGLAVLGSGLLSLLAAEPGKAGLWFGVVMGGLALVASLLLYVRLRYLGMGVAWVAVGFVGGWFIYDVFFQRGLGQGDVRKYAVLVLTLLVAAVLGAPARKNSKTSVLRNPEPENMAG